MRIPPTNLLQATGVASGKAMNVPAYGLPMFGSTAYLFVLPRPPPTTSTPLRLGTRVTAKREAPRHSDRCFAAGSFYHGAKNSAHFDQGWKETSLETVVTMDWKRANAIRKEPWWIWKPLGIVCRWQGREPEPDWFVFRHGLTSWRLKSGQSGRKTRDGEARVEKNTFYFRLPAPPK